MPKMVAPSLVCDPFVVGHKFVSKLKPIEPRNMAHGHNCGTPSFPRNRNTITAVRAVTRFAKGPAAVINNRCRTRRSADPGVQRTLPALAILRVNSLHERPDSHRQHSGPI